MDYLIRAIDILTLLLLYAIFARVILSWFNIRPGSGAYPILVLLSQITEPILGPLRRIIPRAGMFDFAPMAAIFLLYIIRVLVRSFL